jgi:hypothetical protein
MRRSDRLYRTPGLRSSQYPNYLLNRFLFIFCSFSEAELRLCYVFKESRIRVMGWQFPHYWRAFTE